MHPRGSLYGVLRCGFAICLAVVALPGAVDAGPAPFARLGDVSPGIDTSLGSSPNPFCSLGDRVLFAATNVESNRREYWASDGTELGTYRLPPIYSPFMSNAVGERTRCVIAGGFGYWPGGSLLFRSDGTPGGTRVIVNPAAAGKDARMIAAAGNRAIFSVPSGPLSTPLLLWSTDGTDSGTAQIVSSQFSTIGDMAASGQGAAYFLAAPVGGTYALWKTDGIPGGDTKPVPLPVAEISNLTVAGDVLYFTSGSRLMRTDGATTETLTGFIAPQGNGQLPMIGTEIGYARGPGAQFWLFDTATSISRQVFSRSGGFDGALPPVGVTGGRWLVSTAEGSVTRQWWSDGTAAGTAELPGFVALDGVSPAPESPRPPFLFTARGGLVWRSDGTRAGTRAIPGSLGRGGVPWIGIYGAQVVGAEKLFFADTDPVHGEEPWVVDPVGETVRLLADLAFAPFNSSTLSIGEGVGASAVFGVRLQTGSQVWRSDGTGNGTGPLVDPSAVAVPGTLQSIGSPRADGVTIFGDLVTSPGFQFRLWRTNGTRGDTAIIAALPSGILGWPVQIHEIGPRWLAQVGRTPPRVWQSDGTSEGTAEVTDLPANPFANTLSRPFADSRSEMLLFAGQAPGDAAGVELWRTDGTAAGTLRVADLVPGSTGSNPGGFVADTGEFHALFGTGTTDVPDRFNELWGTDGTPTHTRRLATFPESSWIHSFLRLPSGRVIALVQDANHRLELLHVPEGGAVPERLAQWDRPTAQGLNRPRLVTAGSMAYFAAFDGGHGVELWATDGFSARRVVDAAPGPASGFDFSNDQPFLAAAGNRVVFLASDDKGVEPWVSDGTTGGTYRLMDLKPGPAGSSPVLIAKLSSYWIFQASDGSTGVEPWSLRLAALDEPRPVLGDLDGDGDVDSEDLELFAAALGTRVGDADFAPSADLDGDGVISLVDYQQWLVQSASSTPASPSLPVPTGGPTPVPMFPYPGWALALAVLIALPSLSRARK